MLKTIAIIPARGGSKGIPGKNVRMIAGKPLLAHSIIHAKQTPAVTRVIVSTDDEEIAAVAREWGAEAIPRPAEISGDTASSESALFHALDWLLTTEHYEPELVVFLQATSPIRAPGDIQRAIETLKREGADSLFSACQVEGFTWRLAGGAVAPVNYDPVKRPLRQELKEEIWEENGSFYVFKPWVLRKLNSRLGGRIVMLKMERVASFQIDEPADFELVEALMRYRDVVAQEIEDGRSKMEGGSTLPSPISHLPIADSHSPSPNSHLLSSIKLLVLDFDGVMTDNRVLVTEEGKEAVFCNRGDGLGLERLRAKGIEVIVLSKEKNAVVNARCRKLGLECLQGCDNKLAALQALSGKRQAGSGKREAQSAPGLAPSPLRHALSPSEIAYVGNDVNDLECLRWVGLPIAVADAAPEVLALAKITTTKRGGHGAVREVCELLLGAKRLAPCASRFAPCAFRLPFRTSSHTLEAS